MKVQGHDIDAANQDKIFFPKIGLTKGDVLEYYQKISSKMLPHLQDRPLTMFRAPDGLKKKGFFQKNISDYFPSWIPSKKIKNKQKKGYTTSAICNDKAGLIYLADQGCLEFHIWLSKKDSLDKPDRLIFDLDPPKDRFDLVKQAAGDLKKVLQRHKLPSFLMTTGSEGLHLIIPLKRTHSFEKVRNYAKKLIKELIEKHPKKYTEKSAKSGRSEKVYIDYLRNAYAQTHIAPYSIRAKENAPIAVPISWQDLQKKDFHSQYYHLKNAYNSIFKRRKDPWKGFEKKHVSLPLD